MVEKVNYFLSSVVLCDRRFLLDFENFSFCLIMSSAQYVHELPYEPRSQLCRILDADGRWEELG